MSYVIMGRAVKNEHLALGILTTVFGGAALAMRGKKEPQVPVNSQSIRQLKESVPINAGSSEEEQFIKNFIAEAEKEEAKH